MAILSNFLVILFDLKEDFVGNNQKTPILVTATFFYKQNIPLN